MKLGDFRIVRACRQVTSRMPLLAGALGFIDTASNDGFAGAGVWDKSGIAITISASPTINMDRIIPSPVIARLHFRSFVWRSLSDMLTCTSCCFLRNKTLPSPGVGDYIANGAPELL